MLNVHSNPLGERELERLPLIVRKDLDFDDMWLLVEVVALLHPHIAILIAIPRAQIRLARGRFVGATAWSWLLGRALMTIMCARPSRSLLGLTCLSSNAEYGGRRNSFSRGNSLLSM